jgi:glycine cleavage system H protein
MNYPTDLKYTRDHEWVRLAGDVAEIGITSFAQDQLGDVIFVDLPDPGQTITAGQTFGSIDSVKAVSELFAPMSGEVIEVNTALKAHPETVNTAPHDAWMIRIRLSEADTSALLDAGQYEALISA